MRGNAALALALSSLTLAFGQQGGAPPAPAFEVASVKTASPLDAMRIKGPHLRGGPGTSDPERFGCTWIGLKTLVEMAWELRPFELDDSRLKGQTAGYSIEAKIPPNTSNRDFHLMLQRLLVERLHLAVHWEFRTLPVFVLVVAKSGPKLHEAEPATGEEAAPSVVPPWAQKPGPYRDAKGKLQIPPGHPGVANAMVGGAFRLMGRMQSSQDIAKAMEPEAGRRVIDKTGLTGLYDYTLDYSPVMDYSVNGLNRPGGSAESIGEAVLHQLGLEMKADKAQVSVLVVDHFDSQPSEN
jgi:uncharacterized protein (TIGR03435 family)